MSSGQQAAAGVAGIGLIGANYWLGGAHQTITTGLGKPGATTDQQTAAHASLKTVLIELAFVGVGVMIAGINDTAGTTILVILAALIILWAMNHYGKK